MLLLADSGSTKCSWCLLADNQPPLHFTTEGYNPYFLGTPAIAASLRAALPAGLVPGAVRAVHFYGAGVLSATHAEVVAGALRQVFPAAAAHVAEDLLAAARALLGRQPGFVAILGTGTNSGLYDGEKITQVVESLGYSLGDEGSGTYIGRQVLRDYLRGRLPPHLAPMLQAEYQLGEVSQVLDRLYSQPLPNRFLASFARFVGLHAQEPYCQAVVTQAFEAFFEQIVTHYPGYQGLTFNCVGSVAYHFREALAATAARHGMAGGRIVPAPMAALVEYHQQVEGG